MEQTTSLSTPITQERALRNSYENLKQKISQLFTLSFNSFKRTVRAGHTIGTNSLSSMNGNNRKFNIKKVLFAAIPVVVVLVLITVISQALRSQPQVQSVLPANASSEGFVKSTDPLTKTFTFPILDAKNKEIGNFTYEVQNAELRKEIIVKGQRATAVEGRIFLIVNLKLKNNLEQGLQINTRDFARLMINNNRDELLAPDIHNDPVEVQAISTKYTRVGFAMNEKDSDKLTLIIGEINKDKEELPLNFK